MELIKVSRLYDITSISDLLLRGELEILPDNSIYRFFGTVKYNNEDLKICAFEYTKDKETIELFNTTDETLRSLTVTQVNQLIEQIKLLQLE